MDILDKNQKTLKKFDTVHIIGDSGLWIIVGFDGGDVLLQNMQGQILTRMPQNVAKLSA
ncbi:hypothetical protein [Zhongshania sp.]|uniref:hypothetical protein n=1 Tax=Zhongshania sp. TaxID=1971902 RepID=UPI003565044D